MISVVIDCSIIFLMFIVWNILYMHAFIGYFFFGKKYANELYILPVKARLQL